MDSKTAILGTIDDAFGGLPRPDRFHPDDGDLEGNDHDALLQSRSLETLDRRDIKSGWDPFLGALPEGIAFYMPTLARFVIDCPYFDEGAGDPYWFLRHFISYVDYNGPANEFLSFCDQAKRMASCQLLQYLSSVVTSWPEVDVEEIESLRVALKHWCQYRETLL